jgi:phospholipid/cholesterol/gamma-HCH transport system substrate-binding protein
VPSQQQVKWAQLRVGLTVLFASVTLAVLIFLMTGATGLFTRKITLKTYIDNAEGLRVGAPVRLQGVDIGNVTKITVVPHHQPNPVEVTMKVSTKYLFNLRKDSTVRLRTAGVLGETFVDVSSLGAKGPEAQAGDVLPAMETAGIEDVVRSSQTTLENANILLKRIDRIVGFVESGEGSIGKLIYDENLYRRLNSTLREVQSLVSDVSRGRGSVGKLIVSDELYNKANASVDKLNRIIDDIYQGHGTAGKFIKDPALYNNANQTIANANKLLADINAGQGALGKFAKDEAFARKLDNTITKLSLLADRMESGEGTAGRILNDPGLYNNADQMLVETRSLIKAIRENPKRYLTIRFKLF